MELCSEAMEDKVIISNSRRWFLGTDVYQKGGSGLCVLMLYQWSEDSISVSLILEMISL